MRVEIKDSFIRLASSVDAESSYSTMEGQFQNGQRQFFFFFLVSDNSQIIKILYPYIVSSYVNLISAHIRATLTSDVHVQDFNNVRIVFDHF